MASLLLLLVLPQSRTVSAAFSPYYTENNDANADCWIVVTSDSEYASWNRPVYRGRRVNVVLDDLRLHHHDTIDFGVGMIDDSAHCGAALEATIVKTH